MILKTLDLISKQKVIRGTPSFATDFACELLKNSDVFQLVRVPNCTGIYSR